MSIPAAHHRKGVLLGLTGGILLSLDVPLLRLSHADAWTAMAWRGIMIFTVIFLYWLILRLAKRPVAPFINGWPGLLVSLIYAVSSALFMLAVHRTTTANLVFILAFMPMFAALFSWVFLGEKISMAAWLTFMAAVAGILIIVQDSMGRGNLDGDLLALAVAIGMAGALTLTRWSGRDLSLSPAMGQLISGLFALSVVTPAMPASFSFGWLALNGFLVVPLALAFLALGPQYLPAPEVAIFFLLESVLAPLWVWLFLGEQASLASLVGGAIVITSILAHSLWQLKHAR